MNQHTHEWGIIKRAHFTGNPYRTCECGLITLDLSDDDE